MQTTTELKRTPINKKKKKNNCVGISSHKQAES